MSDLWDGDSMPDAIGRHLEEGGFAPFGVGVPFAARDAARDWIGEVLDGPVFRARLEAAVHDRHNPVAATIAVVSAALGVGA